MTGNANLGLKILWADNIMGYIVILQIIKFCQCTLQ